MEEQFLKEKAKMEKQFAKEKAHLEAHLVVSQERARGLEQQVELWKRLADGEGCKVEALHAQSREAAHQDGEKAGELKGVREQLALFKDSEQYRRGLAEKRRAEDAKSWEAWKTPKP